MTPPGPHAEGTGTLTHCGKSVAFQLFVGTAAAKAEPSCTNDAVTVTVLGPSVAPNATEA